MTLSGYLRSRNLFQGHYLAHSRKWCCRQRDYIPFERPDFHGYLCQLNCAGDEFWRP